MKEVSPMEDEKIYFVGPIDCSAWISGRGEGHPQGGPYPDTPRATLDYKNDYGVPPVPWTIYGLGFKPCIAVVAGSVLDLSSS